MPLQARITSRHLLSEADREAMLDLHVRYFDNVSRGRFFADLAEKDWVIQLMDGARLAGFSTQRVIHLPVDGRTRRFLFSGDTIVDRAYWREQALAGAFGHLMLKMLEEHGGEECYWFLISKGHRTFRFLPVFFERFIPGPGSPDDARLRALLDAVARFKFGPAYDPGAGLVRALGQSDRLRPEWCAPPDRLENDRFVSFFLQRNPGFASGDELACLAEIRRDNLNRFAWRVIGRTQPVWRA